MVERYVSLDMKLGLGYDLKIVLEFKNVTLKPHHNF